MRAMGTQPSGWGFQHFCHAKLVLVQALEQQLGHPHETIRKSHPCERTGLYWDVHV